MVKKHIMVLLNTIEKACWFANQVQYTFWGKQGYVTVEQDRYMVDGGSVMGLFALNLTMPLGCTIVAPDEKVLGIFENNIAQVIFKKGK